MPLEVIYEGSIVYVYIRPQAELGYEAHVFKQFVMIICPWKFAIKCNILFTCLNSNHILSFTRGGSRGRDCMVVGLTTTCAINVYHH